MTTHPKTTDDREPDPLPSIGEAPPLTLGELAEAATLSEVRLGALEKIIKKCEIDRDVRVSQTRERLEGVHALGHAQRESALVEEAANAQRAAVEASAAARAERFRELGAINERVNAVAPLFASPIVILSRASLGDPARTQLEAQLLNAGPSTLRNYALLAIATKNIKLGAALVAIADRIPRSQRSFSPHEIAQRLVGEDWAAADASIRAVRNRVQEAVLRNRFFERGAPLSPTSKISIGLAKRAERAATGA